MIKSTTSLNRFILLASVVFFGASFYSNTSFAETIQIPVGSQGSELQIDKPSTGQSKQTVIEYFGEPLERRPAVGEPPIARWEFENFYVFFEYDHVIHSVLKHRPKQ